MKITNLNEMSDAGAISPHQFADTISTATTYNKPGLPKPPGGWNYVPPMSDSVDTDDEGPESRDQYE